MGKFFLSLWFLVYFLTFILPKSANLISRLKNKPSFLISTQFTKEITNYDLERKILLDKLYQFPKEKLYLFLAPDFYDYVLFNFHLYPLRLVHVKDLKDSRAQIDKYDYLVILKSDYKDDIRQYLTPLKPVYQTETAAVFQIWK